jgi:DNA invertase Pin-like site-specific DNA recombinase
MDSADAAPRGYRIGYGRVSARDQNPDSQRDALEAAGRAETERPGPAQQKDPNR